MRRILLFGKASLAALFAALFLHVSPAEAHLLNMSRIDIALIDEQQVIVTAELDLTRTFGSAEAYFQAAQIADPLRDSGIAQKLRNAARAIELSAGDVTIDLAVTAIRFEQQSLADYQSPLAWPRATVTFAGKLPVNSAPENSGVRVRFDDSFIFEEPLATTLRSAADDAVKSRWLVTFQRSPVLRAPAWFDRNDLAASADSDTENAGPVFANYMSLGFWHIVPDGADHLLFVLALVLAAASVRALLIVLALYTVAHSVSFGAAALGLLPPTMLPVESLIILSIVVAALLNLRTSAASKSAPWLAFGFGLLHGLGFANALTGAGLPTEQRLLSLLGFNVGVEAAQLLWVMLLAPIWWLCRYSANGEAVRKGLSLGIAILALWWLLA